MPSAVLRGLKNMSACGRRVFAFKSSLNGARFGNVVFKLLPYIAASLILLRLFRDCRQKFYECPFSNVSRKSVERQTRLWLVLRTFCTKTRASFNSLLNYGFKNSKL